MKDGLRGRVEFNASVRGNLKEQQMTSTVRPTEPVYGIEFTGKASMPYQVYRLGIIGSPRVWLNVFDKYWQATTWVDKLMSWHSQWNHAIRYDNESIAGLAKFWQEQCANDYICAQLATQRKDYVDIAFWQQEQATDHKRAWAFLYQLIHTEPEDAAI
jgi:hypothetical protein